MDTIIWLSCLGGISAFLLVITMLYLIYYKNSKRKKSFAKDFEISGAKFIHSAPQTRASSPTLYAKNENNHPSSSISRSTNMSDIYAGLQTKPPERVQPKSPFLTTNCSSTLGIHQIHQQLGGDQLSSGMRVSYDAEMESSGSYQVHNALYFSVLYKKSSSNLCITVIKADGLTGRGRSKNELRDPFVKLCLLNDEKVCHQTATATQTFAPVYNETFTFEVEESALYLHILKLSLYDVDTRRIRHTLGHVYLPLDSIDLEEGGILIRTLEQSNQYQVAAGFGEVNVGLYFDPAEEKCNVTILEAKDLKKLDLNGDEQIYVKVQLMEGQKTSRVKKSSTIPAARDPDFNESFNFSLPSSQLDSTSIRISLMVLGLDLHETLYGRIFIGSYLYARGSEQEHWQEMTENKRKTITKWHSLALV